MDYDAEIQEIKQDIIELYKMIADLKEWLLKNTPTLKELSDIKKQHEEQITDLNYRIQRVEQKLR